MFSAMFVKWVHVNISTDRVCPLVGQQEIALTEDRNKGKLPNFFNDRRIALLKLFMSGKSQI